MIRIDFDQMTEQPESVLTLARICTIKALSRIGQDWQTTAEFEDMQGQAAWKIFQAMQTYPGKHILYYYVTGINSALEWRRAWRMGVRGVRDPQMASVNFSDVFHKGGELDEMDEDRFSQLAYMQHYFDTSTLYETLVSWFLDDRDKKGDRGQAAAQRDADICIWAAQGLSNQEISEVTGVKVSTIKEYRKRIRALLRKRLDGAVADDQPATPIEVDQADDEAESENDGFMSQSILQKLRDANLFADEEDEL